MLSYGCTRLEIRVQSTYEDVARDTNRGHTVAAVADCFCLAKDAGFKIDSVGRQWLHGYSNLTSTISYFLKLFYFSRSRLNTLKLKLERYEERNQQN
ncbi:hypothetical protein ACS0TY_015675 [Phlomoides rotata]